MKSVLISLLFVIGFQAQAQEHQDILAGNGSAPIFAQMKMHSVSRNMSAIKPVINFESNINITFNSKHVTLDIQPGMPDCPPNAFCAQVMPQPQRSILTVKKIERTGCSVRYFASTPENVRTTVYEQVVIEDFSFSVCEMVYTNLGNVKYSATGVSRLSQQQETATAVFNIPEFTRAAN